MRRWIKNLVLMGTVMFVAAGAAPSAIGQSIGPAQLQRAGWSCLLPPPFNPNVHCFPPGQLEGVLAGTARTALTVAFATDDLTAEDAPRLGTERMIRADLFHGQPCPTDPPGTEGETSNPSLYRWSWLYPRFGWDYYICHTFDSPW